MSEFVQEHVVSTKDLKNAIVDSQNLLDIPDGADIKGTEGEPGFGAVWNEIIDITKVAYAVSKKGTGWWVARLEATVAPDIDGANAGRTLILTWPIFPPALSDRRHEFRGLTSAALKMLNSLAEACGTSLPEAGSINNLMSENSNLAGTRVGVTISRYVKKNGDTEQSARAFSAVTS